jgi:hypothetical protein
MHRLNLSNSNHNRAILVIATLALVLSIVALLWLFLTPKKKLLIDSGEVQLLAEKFEGEKPEGTTDDTIRFASKVDFRVHFSRPPTVVISLNYIDVGLKGIGKTPSSTRIAVAAEVVDERGFFCVFRSWKWVPASGANATWIAYGE